MFEVRLWPSTEVSDLKNAYRPLSSAILFASSYASVVFTSIASFSIISQKGFTFGTSNPALNRGNCLSLDVCSKACRVVEPMPLAGLFTVRLKDSSS